MRAHLRNIDHAAVERTSIPQTIFRTAKAAVTRLDLTRNPIMPPSGGTGVIGGTPFSAHFVKAVTIAGHGLCGRGPFYRRLCDIPQMGTRSTADTVGLTALGVVGAAVCVHAVGSADGQRRRHNQQPSGTEHQTGNEDKQV